MVSCKSLLVLLALVGLITANDSLHKRTYQITPLGTPRMLVNDPTIMQHLRDTLTAATPAATRFKSACDNQVAHPDQYFSDWNVALLGQVTGQTSYCTYAVGRTDAFVASEEAIINSNHAPTVAGDSYLQIGPIIGGMSIIYDWCRPQTTASQRARWMAYGNLAVSNLWNQTHAKWGNATIPGNSWAVNDPSDNYYYSFLRATMTLGLATYGENSLAQTWIDQFRTVKLQNQLVPEFISDLVGGGSREGTGYGVSMKGLFDLYFWWEKSTGERIADLTPHTLASLDKFMHDIQPTFDYIMIVGDQSRESTGAFFDYHREYLLVASALYPTDPMAGAAKTLLAQCSVPAMTQNFEYWIDYLYANDAIPAQPLSILPSAHWGSGTGQFTVRSSWTDLSATWANFICGPYTQSHAHQDQLSFMIYKGALLASDETYDSSSGLRQEEAAHGLVRVFNNGAEIRMPVNSNPCVMKALVDNSAYAYAFGDVTPMFQSPNIQKLQREFVFLKPGTFVVFDRIDTTGTNVTRAWTINMHKPPTVNSNNILITNTNQGSHTLNVVRLAPSSIVYNVVNYSQVVDPYDRLRGWRVDEQDLSATPSSIFLHVLGTDNSFSSAVASNSAGFTGTLITFADGSTALVKFSTTGTGGTITLTDSSGHVTRDEALPSTVTTPPRFASGATTTATVSTTSTTAKPTTTTATTTTTTTTTTTSKPTTTTSTTTKLTTATSATTFTSSTSKSTTGGPIRVVTASGGTRFLGWGILFFAWIVLYG